jgi:hypothetical protein
MPPAHALGKGLEVNLTLQATFLFQAENVSEAILIDLKSQLDRCARVWLLVSDAPLIPSGWAGRG